MAYRKPAQQQILEARRACQEIAEGDFTPVVFERYELIGGEKGYMLGFPHSNGIAWRMNLKNKGE